MDSRNTTVAGENGYYWTMGGMDVTNFYPSDRVLGTSMNGTVISKLTSESSKDYVASLEITAVTGYTGPSFYWNGAAIPVADNQTGDTFTGAPKTTLCMFTTTRFMSRLLPGPPLPVIRSTL